MNADFPFAWQLRLSKRAKRPRLTISSYGEVELVWPYRMPKHYMQSMLSQHTAWVLKQLSTLNIQERTNMDLPESIDFVALGQKWALDYQSSLISRIQLNEQGFTLTVTGDVDDKEQVRQALLAWVKKKGRQYLKPWLADAAQEMGLSYGSVAIRLQKRRWGSCSAKKNINLNAGLLFLPDFLVRHVLIHELTHLKHLNHSPAFWQDVKKFDANYKENRKLLQQYGLKLPMWLHQSFDDNLHK